MKKSLPQSIQLNNKSEKMLGENNPMYGLKGELNPNFGKEKPQSFYDKHKKTWTDDRRKEHSKRLSGENNGMYGKKCSEERAKKFQNQIKTLKNIFVNFAERKLMQVIIQDGMERNVKIKLKQIRLKEHFN